MTAPFTIDLTIDMPDGGRLAKQLLNLYFADMPEDIDAAARQLCEADEALQARKFANLTVKRADVWAGQQGSLNIFALLSVYGEDPAFLQQVIASYMQGFADSLKRAGEGYFSHDGLPPGISLQPTNWSAEVHPA